MGHVSQVLMRVGMTPFREWVHTPFSARLRPAGIRSRIRGSVGAVIIPRPLIYKDSRPLFGFREEPLLSLGLMHGEGAGVRGESRRYLAGSAHS